MQFDLLFYWIKNEGLQIYSKQQQLLRLCTLTNKRRALPDKLGEPSSNQNLAPSQAYRRGACHPEFLVLVTFLPLCGLGNNLTPLIPLSLQGEEEGIF